MAVSVARTQMNLREKVFSRLYRDYRATLTFMWDRYCVADEQELCNIVQQPLEVPLASVKQTDRKRTTRRVKPRYEYFYVPVKTAETIPRSFDKNKNP